MDENVPASLMQVSECFFQSVINTYFNEVSASKRHFRLYKLISKLIQRPKPVDRNRVPVAKPSWTSCGLPAKRTRGFNPIRYLFYYSTLSPPINFQFERLCSVCLKSSFTVRYHFHTAAEKYAA